MDQYVLELIGAIGVLASGLVATIKWGFPWLKRCLNNMLGNAKIHSRLDEVQESMAYLVAEMKLNGGTSIRDHLVRIEKVVILTNEIQHARMLDSPDMIFRADAEGHIEWVNRTFARTVQRLPAELEGHGWVSALSEDQRDEMAERWYTSIEEDREIEMTLEFQTPEGNIFPALLRSYRMDDSAGETLGYLATITLT